MNGFLPGDMAQVDVPRDERWKNDNGHNGRIVVIRRYNKEWDAYEAITVAHESLISVPAKYLAPTRDDVDSVDRQISNAIRYKLNSISCSGSYPAIMAAISMWPKWTFRVERDDSNSGWLVNIL